MKKYYLFAIGLLLPMLSVQFAMGQIHLVPQEYSSIQEAINMSSAGDTVIVDTGTYYENIRFRGKNIVVTSKYIFEKDTSYISRTIIDGSQPEYPDSASCVYFEAGETAEAVLQGFTLTGGAGTKVITVGDNPLSFREGGAISIESSSPTIQFNLITENYVRNTEGIDFVAGGGAIRCRYCDATIQNNVIMKNEGFHNGGIAIYWSSATVRNNIIYQNLLSKEFGGAALLIENNTGPTIIENNTIVANKSVQSSVTGGIHLKNGNIEARNNIIWGNTQKSNAEIGGNGEFTMSYNNNQQPEGDVGDVDLSPDFSNAFFQLKNSSPLIDAGDPDGSYNDAANSPALGEIRNDIGVYGGPAAAVLPAFEFADIYAPASIFLGVNYPDSSRTKNLVVKNLGTSTISIEQVTISGSSAIHIEFDEPIVLSPISDTALELTWMPTDLTDLDAMVSIYHNSSEIENPIEVGVTGTIREVTTGLFELNKSDQATMIISCIPNPFSHHTLINFQIGYTQNARLVLSDIFGREHIVLQDRTFEAGGYRQEISAENLIPGIYYISLITGDDIQTQTLQIR